MSPYAMTMACATSISIGPNCVASPFVSSRNQPASVEQAHGHLTCSIAVVSCAGRPSSLCQRPSRTILASSLPHSMVVMEARVGQATMVPPSIHPSGESLEWIEPDIVDIAAETLQQRCGLLAFLSVVQRCYPGEGARHDVGIALSGALVRAGYDGDEANWLTRLVAERAGDGEAEARGDGNGAAEKLVAGQEVAGLPRLRDLLGLPEDVARAFAKWLRHTEAPEGAIVLDNDRSRKTWTRWMRHLPRPIYRISSDQGGGCTSRAMPRPIKNGRVHWLSERLAGG